MNATKILPCPFCGSAPFERPKSTDAFISEYSQYAVAVWCERCDAQGPSEKTEREAIEAWNRRAALQEAKDTGK